LAFSSSIDSHTRREPRIRTRGLETAKGRRRFFLKATYIWQIATKWGTVVPSSPPLFFLFLFYGVFVRFSTRGVQKHHKKLFGESPCQKLLAKKVEICFSLSYFPFDFFNRVFGRFSA
jgi:hypothetical protein